MFWQCNELIQICFESLPFVMVSVSKKICIGKSIGISFENLLYRKKYRYRSRNKFVLKKVSVSVSKFFGFNKSIGIGFEFFLKKYWNWKSLGFSDYKLVLLNSVVSKWSMLSVLPVLYVSSELSVLSVLYCILLHCLELSSIIQF